MGVSVSIKLPLKETARVSCVKLPIIETVSLLNGFIITENIVSWKEKDIVLFENIQSFITTIITLIDKNNISLEWYGNAVPKVQIFKRGIDEVYSNIPYIELPWSPSKYIMKMDINGYVLKVIGSDNTGVGQEFQIGGSQDYNMNIDLKLPINEKKYYIILSVNTKYTIGVNI